MNPAEFSVFDTVHIDPHQSSYNKTNRSHGQLDILISSFPTTSKHNAMITARIEPQQVPAKRCKNFSSKRSKVIP